LFFLASDVILISLAVYLAFLFRLEFAINGQSFPALEKTLILALIFNIPIFYFFGLYSFSWSYVSTRELTSLLKAATLAFLLSAVILFFSRDFPSFVGFPRSVLFVSYFLTLLFTGGIRLAKRIYLQIIKKGNGDKQERTLLVGAGDAAEQILRSIQGSPDTPYFPIGFVDDSPFKQGNLIHGVKVLGKIEDIPGIVKKEGAERVIVALPSADSSVIKKAVEKSRAAGLKKIKILPALSEIVNEQVSLTDVRDFKMEDLLERQPLLYDPSSMEKFIQGKIVLITGAAGSIGSELARQTAKFRPARLLLLDQDETGVFNISKELRIKFPELNPSPVIADIRDKEKIRRIFSEFRPNLVFHAAAYKHVPLMEQYPEEAIKNNVFGTEIVSKAALDYGAKKFIFISTDKAINSCSVMGATKRIGEMICLTLNQKGATKFISVRFGNVLGSRGSVIPIFKEQIKKGGPLEVTHQQMKRYFMVIPEAVSLVLQAGQIGQGGEVFVLNMGNPVRILDLAKELIRFSGLEPDKDIPIVFSGPRPGEKFFEEILTAEEGTIATENQNIFRAKLSNVDEEKLNRALEKLRNSPNDLNPDQILTLLKEIL